MNTNTPINWNLQSRIPKLVKTDSYKAGHFSMYPECQEMTAYIEARTPFRKGDDLRIVHMGAQYFVDKYLRDPITHSDIDEAVEFYATHNVMGTAYPFPEDLFRKVVDEHNGFFPIKVRALAEGTVIYARTPQVVITAKGEFARLVTFMETALLSCVWYMSTVATHSRLAKQAINDAFDISVEAENYWKLGSRLHDFGYRGCTSEEQALMGGLAHLVNFDGTDTMCAAWASRQLDPDQANFDCSIPATEHSVMTCWDQELDAVLNMANLYGHGVFATVADSYDYDNFLNEIVPQVAPIVLEKDGFHVVRPDSGNPVDCVVRGLQALEKAYGVITNSRGYKVINNAGIIQGDGIGLNDIKEILEATMAAGYSAENVAFGMGAGLLQKLNRDTCSYAMKLSERVDNDGTRIPIMKAPKTDMTKASLPGNFTVTNSPFGPTTYPYTPGWTNYPEMLVTIYDCGDFKETTDTFSVIRKRVEIEWNQLPATVGLPWSKELEEVRNKVYAELTGI
jgi:nicotinic acid phosphoribosyltransferase